MSTSSFRDSESYGVFGSSMARNSPVALLAPVLAASVVPRCVKCLIVRACMLGCSLCIKSIAVEADSYVLSRLPSSMIIISLGPR